MKEDKKMYIGEVAKELKVHEQTIREYERKHLIKPARTEMNIRYFTQKDLNRLILIITLTNELHLNLAGVKLILALTKKLKMNDDELLDFIEDHINEFSH